MRCPRHCLGKSLPQGVTLRRLAIPNADAQNEVHFFPVFVILCHFINVFLKCAEKISGIKELEKF